MHDFFMNSMLALAVLLGIILTLVFLYAAGRCYGAGIKRSLTTKQKEKE